MDELSDNQLAELKQDLFALKKQLEIVLAGSKDVDKPVDLDLPIGRLTRMDTIQQQKMESAERRQAQIRLGQVGAAFRLMAEDEYGYCRKCDEPIEFGRLKARPEAPLCLECQNDVEGKRR